MSDYTKNVFQIWREHGENVPFKVRRWSWHHSTHAVVTEVVVKKWPYGVVDGYLVRFGVRTGGRGCLSCAGCYQWQYVE